MGLLSLDHQDYVYPRENEFDRESIEKWIKDLSRGKVESSSKKMFSSQENDETIAGYFLPDTLPADREVLEQQLLPKDTDSVVLFYSTEFVNYH